MLAEPVSQLSETLESIWERALGREHVALDDDFFDLGGNLNSALEIFSEVRRLYAIELCPVTIFETRTIRSLAKALEQKSPPPIPALTLLRRGTRGSPLFVTHGNGGNLLELFGLVQRLDWNGDIYGMQAKGSNGAAEPLDDVASMAAYFLPAIKQAQPAGPYFLVGYSFGGLVMLEIAGRMKKAGDEIALLAMIDCYPHISQLPLVPKVRLYGRLIARRLGEALGISKAAYERETREQKASYGPILRSVQEATLRALMRYRPQRYPGKIQFIRAREITVFPEPKQFWTPMVESFELETVPGNHHGMLREHCESSAKALSRFLDQSLKGSRR